ncbi:glycosyl transferase [Neisseria chenwenguii]|uniref:Glycosyl transferase n=1 Tax=Neisseria chenwenguii TaxID=1853278 RepID=A0A220S041_9NEIS|nr:glycosyltransferase [Neisseria chenwenguii]ASK26850.1 glycosyl transferase [Neisseria chenwenguii]
MHVLVIPSWYPATPDDVDGIFFRQQAQALQRSGLKVGVVAPIFRSMRGKPASILTGGYGVRSYVEADIPTYVYKSMYFFPRMPRDRGRWVKAGKKLFDRYVAEQGRPDVIHVHCVSHAGILAQQIFEETGIPYVITEHSSTYARKLVHDWQWGKMRTAVEKSGRRFAVSRTFCTLLEEIFAGSDWEYLPNILSAPFAAPVDLASFEKDEDFTFCSVAHLRRNKGYDILLPAFALALKKYPQLKLKIGGGGEADGELRKLAAELGLNASVTFLGALTNTEVLDLMRKSHAFVLASRYETFGVVYIEAVSQGLPVVATRCGGPETTVTPENGLLVPSENVEALADALIEIYENRSRYRAEDLRAGALAEYGESSVVARLTEAFESLVSQKQQNLIGNELP